MMIKFSTCSFLLAWGMVAMAQLHSDVMPVSANTHLFARSKRTGTPTKSTNTWTENTSLGNMPVTIDAVAHFPLVQPSSGDTRLFSRAGGSETQPESTNTWEENTSLGNMPVAIDTPMRFPASASIPTTSTGKHPSTPATPHSSTTPAGSTPSDSDGSPPATPSGGTISPTASQTTDTSLGGAVTSSSATETPTDTSDDDNDDNDNNDDDDGDDDDDDGPLVLPVLKVDWDKVTTKRRKGVDKPSHDSDGHPIFPPHCGVCGPSINFGFTAFGFPSGPGVINLPKINPPPGFKKNAPQITLNEKGDPSWETKQPDTSTQSPDQSSTSTSTSTSCTENAVTNTKYFVTLLTNTAGSTTETSTVSSTLITTTGCSLTPSSTESTITGSTTLPPAPTFRIYKDSFQYEEQTGLFEEASSAILSEQNEIQSLLSIVSMTRPTTTTNTTSTTSTTMSLPPAPTFQVFRDPFLNDQSNGGAIFTTALSAIMSENEEIRSLLASITSASSSGNGTTPSTDGLGTSSLKPTSASSSDDPASNTSGPGVPIPLPSSSSSQTSSTSVVLPTSHSCHDLGNMKYVWREKANETIVNKFCPEAAKQRVQDKNSGAISRTYFQGTKNEVELAIDWPPGDVFVPNKEDCVLALGGQVLDKCPADSHTNPNTWTRGGAFNVGNVTYRIDPKVEAFKKGRCRFHFKETAEKERITVAVDVHDGADTLLYSLSGAGDFNETFTVPAEDTHLPDDVTIELVGGPIGSNFEEFPVKVTIGIFKWQFDQDSNTEGDLPNCDGGAWDEPVPSFWDSLLGKSGGDPNRQADCYWHCPPTPDDLLASKPIFVPIKAPPRVK